MATYIKPDAIKDNSLSIEKIDNVALDLADKVNALDDNGKNTFLNKIGLGKIGVISQKQNWKSDYSGYTMSNLVYGIIPQANMDLFFSAGVEFNDTDAPITKTAPWGEDVQHLPGCFYVSGLGDISYKELLFAYELTNSQILQKQFSFMTNFLSRHSDSNLLRVNMPWLWQRVGYLATMAELLSFNFGNYVNEIPQVLTLPYSDYYGGIREGLFKPSNMKRFFGYGGGIYTIAIATPIDMSGCNTEDSMYSAFINAYALRYIFLRNLSYSANFKDSRWLSTKSIIYMITYVSNTPDITITLHPNAYARAMADAEILAALETHTNVSLASA